VQIENKRGQAGVERKKDTTKEPNELPTLFQERKRDGRARLCWDPAGFKEYRWDEQVKEDENWTPKEQKDSPGTPPRSNCLEQGIEGSNSVGGIFDRGQQQSQEISDESGTRRENLEVKTQTPVGKTF